MRAPLRVCEVVFRRQAADSAAKAGQVADSSSVHGFGYCCRDECASRYDSTTSRLSLCAILRPYKLPLNPDSERNVLMQNKNSRAKEAIDKIVQGMKLKDAGTIPRRRCHRCQYAVMALKALESSHSHAGILPLQPARADSTNLLYVITALCPVIVNHGLDCLQCELSRQVALV